MRAGYAAPWRHRGHCVRTLYPSTPRHLLEPSSLNFAYQQLPNLHNSAQLWRLLQPACRGAGHPAGDAAVRRRQQRVALRGRERHRGVHRVQEGHAAAAGDQHGTGGWGPTWCRWVGAQCGGAWVCGVVGTCEGVEMRFQGWLRLRSSGRRVCAAVSRPHCPSNTCIGIHPTSAVTKCIRTARSGQGHGEVANALKVMPSRLCPRSCSSALRSCSSVLRSCPSLSSAPPSLPSGRRRHPRHGGPHGQPRARRHLCHAGRGHGAKRQPQVGVACMCTSFRPKP